jgi:outer membrane protein TolC
MSKFFVLSSAIFITESHVCRQHFFGIYVDFKYRFSWTVFDLGRVYVQMKAPDANAEANLARYPQTVLNSWKKRKMHSALGGGWETNAKR